MLANDSKINIKIDTTFLQTLIRGEKSLYYYNLEGTDSFYIEQDNKFELLLYKEYLTSKNGKLAVSKNKKYLGQLNIYLNDCKTISSKLKDVSYKKSALVKLFKYYYGCFPSNNILFQKEKDKGKIELGAMAGISLTTLEFKSEDSFFSYLQEANYNSSINPTIGLFLDYILPRSLGKWSIYNEFQFTDYKIKGDYRSLVTTEIGFSYLNMNNLVRYKHPVNDKSLFFNVGISNGLFINETNIKKNETGFFTGLNLPAIRSPLKYERGLIVGTGVKFNRLSFEIRYERGTGMSQLTSLRSRTNRSYFLLGFRF